jgi:16S rRNA processing protein RimM
MSQGPRPDRSTLVCVGAVAGAFGVKGEVRLKSFCADPRAIGDYGPLWSEDGARSFTVSLGGGVAGGLAARLSGVRTREDAEALKGLRLHAERARMPAPGDDEFYHADLIGMEVADTGGAVLGQVAAVLNHGAGDILEVRRAGGSAAMLLPFTVAVVPTVDLAARRIVVDPPGETE